MSFTRPYVCIPIPLGEKVRKRLLAAGLLDVDFKIRNENGLLFLPLSHEVAAEELQALLEIEVETGLCEFAPIHSGPRTLAEALDGILAPEQIELIPRAYDLIGDIAVLEIPEELDSFKSEIGRAFHQVHPNFATVLAKRGAITGLIRTREYDVLSGEPKTHTIHTEYGCRIVVDLARAYFSPRLLEEHHRIATQVKDNETVLDMFTGVGPFALHIARIKPAHVIAVDINPDAIALLRKSMALNQLVGTIEPVVGDAMEYVQENLHYNVDRVIMNHPSGAANFVSAACRAVKSGGVIHYYDFIGGEDPERTIREKIEGLVSRSGREIRDVPAIRRVRDSAPYEYQMVIDIIIE
ncbi:MAG: class I SAM-dependent methyltransferase family protein [Candidatus Thorarchaeota archaeon]|nr:class I SAM-dependent methyltransferase family protein [Candidatus Thorarchaeota archaeon]